MFLKKLKNLIYIVLFVFIFSFLLPLYANAIDENNIYVWSNNSSSVSTSTTPNTEQTENNDNSQDNSR